MTRLLRSDALIGTLTCVLIAATAIAYVGIVT